MAEKENVKTEDKFNERKKAMRGYFIKSLIFAGIAAAICAVIGTFLGGILIGLIVAAVVICISAYFVLKNLVSIKRSFCKACGAKYNYERDISWEVSSQQEKERSVVAHVNVECTCPNCGEITEFSVTQTVASIDPKTGRIRQANISNLMKNYFYKPNK